MHHVLHHSGILDERVEEEEEEEDLARMHRCCRTEGGRPEGSYGHADNRELTQNEVDQVRHSKNKIYYHFIMIIICFRVSCVFSFEDNTLGQIRQT